MGIFSKARDMYALQKQSKQIKKELKNIHVEAEVEGVTVTVSADQEFISVSVPDTLWNELKATDFGKKRLEDLFLKACNKGMKKAQEIAGAKMKGLWGQMGIGQ